MDFLLNKDCSNNSQMEAYMLSDLSPKLKELEVLTDGCSKYGNTRIFEEKIFINEVFTLQELSTL